MWDRLSIPWRACLEEAWAAYCAGSIPVGAVVADADGQILTRGRNRAYERDGAVEWRKVSPLAHAEVEALAGLDYAHVDPHACVLFTSQEPCPLCLGALYMSGVREIRFAGRDPYAGSTDLLGTTPYLRRKPIRVVPPAWPLMEIVVSAVTAEFGIRRGTGAAAWELIWLPAWRTAMPEGVALAEELYRSGWLDDQRHAQAPAEVVFDGVAARAG
jgi:tRNA(adenine34) deaminase